MLTCCVVWRKQSLAVWSWICCSRNLQFFPFLPPVIWMVTPFAALIPSCLTFKACSPLRLPTLALSFLQTHFQFIVDRHQLCTWGDAKMLLASRVQQEVARCSLCSEVAKVLCKQWLWCPMLPFAGYQPSARWWPSLPHMTICQLQCCWWYPTSRSQVGLKAQLKLWWRVLIVTS